MPAWKRGFWRRIAAVSVEPARGRPEMKWKVRFVGEDTVILIVFCQSRVPDGAIEAARLREAP
jgi:hypothetical protein